MPDPIKYTIFDTDMYYHLNSPDDKVSGAAKDLFNACCPSAMSAFSLVELKGSFIGNLGLLRRKISDSSSLRQVFVRIENSKIRAAKRMLVSLLNFMDDRDWKGQPWNEVQQEAIVHIDGELSVAWIKFKNTVNVILDEFECTRATEEPFLDRGLWNTRIPKCNSHNRQCSLPLFLNKHGDRIKQLLSYFDRLAQEEFTSELIIISKYLSKAIDNPKPWEIFQCRSIGDLLIGLQSIDHKNLVSSNHREHSHLSKGLGYQFHPFPVAKFRLK